ncbi:MAG TPA: S8 family serine peptidase [Candidatus Polarisedimenticolia bacterium]|nr:S8 family serine peptidase [Candidatus Polarisedimenticolia bacterium]
MRVEMTLRRSMACAGLAALTILGTFSFKLIAQGPGPEVVRVEDRRSDSHDSLVARLSAERVKILEDYGSFALVSITPEQQAHLKQAHLEVSALPERTRTGRGTIFFDTRNGDPAIPAHLQADLAREPLQGHYIVQFIGPIKQEWLQSLQDSGVEFFDYLPSYSFVVSMQKRTAAQIRQLPFLQWVGVYHPAYKIVPSLLQPSAGDRALVVSLFPKENPARVEALLASWGAVVTDRWTQGAATGLQTAIPSDRVLDLARMPEVSWIEESSAPTVSNSDATWVLQSNQNSPQPNRSIHTHGLRGEGQILTFAEGAADTTHPALVGKVQQQIIAGCGGQSGTPDAHATAVASILAGNVGATTTYDCRDGHAPAASLINVFMGLTGGCSISDWYNLVYLPSWQAGVRVHAEGPDEDHFDCNPSYCNGAVQLDQFVWDHKDFLITMPAGNSGGFDQGGMPLTRRIRCAAQAKNLITVGATWNGVDANKMASYSSQGAACDDRRKPTLVAPGGDTLPGNGLRPIVTADTSGTACDGTPNNKYGPHGGTSFAHPAVAGSAALVRQYYTEGWYPSGIKTPVQSFIPSAALIKATLINSAVQMTDNSAYEQDCFACPDCVPPQPFHCEPIFSYPNNVQGWGRILLENALYFNGDARKLAAVDSSPGITGTGDVRDYRVLVSTSNPIQPFQATLAWSDYPGASNSCPSPPCLPQLVNNLDLVVKDPSCTVYNGNNFFNGQSVAGGFNDYLNVEEQVRLNLPVAGVWTVSVKTPNLPHGPQPFALAITGNVGNLLPGLPQTAAAEISTGMETIVSGNFGNTLSSDDSYEVLREVLQNGVSVLEHIWRFDNIPPCQTTLTLNLEGNRPTSSDGDNFKFAWSESQNGTYTDIPNAVIKKTFELQGGIDYPFTRTETSPTIYIKVLDTNRTSGTSLDTVNIDRLEIR